MPAVIVRPTPDYKHCQNPPCSHRRKLLSFARKWESKQEVCNQSGPTRSIHLNVGVLDHLSPQSELKLDEIAQLLGRRGKPFEPDVLEPRLSLRAVDDLTQCAVELGHDVRRRAR